MKIQKIGSKKIAVPDLDDVEGFEKKANLHLTLILCEQLQKYLMLGFELGNSKMTAKQKKDGMHKYILEIASRFQRFGNFKNKL